MVDIIDILLLPDASDGFVEGLVEFGSWRLLFFSGRGFLREGGWVCLLFM